MKSLKLVLSILALVLVFALVACGTPAQQPSQGASETPGEAEAPSEPANDTGDEESAPATPAENYLIKMWFHSGDTVMPDIVEENKGDFNVEYTSVPEEEFERTVRLAIAGGVAPDIVSIDQPDLASYASGGAISPLDDFWPAEVLADYPQSQIDAISFEGNMYAVPYRDTSVLLFYNKAHFAEAGITAPTSLDDAWSFEEFLENSIKLTQLDANGNVEVYGVLPALGAADGTGGAMAYSQFMYLHSTGGRAISPDGSTATGYFDSADTRRALQLFYDLHANNAAPRQGIPDGFMTGKISMWATGPWMIGTFNEFEDLDWGAMPLPKDKVYATGMGSWVMTMTMQSQDKQTTWDFLELLTSPEIMSKYCEASFNLPARKSVSVSFASDGPFKMITEALERFGSPRPATPVYSRVADLVSEAFSAVAFGMDVDEVQAMFTEELNKALS